MIVPVLSRITVSALPVSSNDTAVLNKIPCFAPIPFPTIIATGVASPKAHGQEITSTEIPRSKANPTPFPSNNHTAIVTSAIAITTGTKTPETLSAIFAIGAFVAAASLTVFIICDSEVSSPTLVALQRIYPEMFIVAALTSSPAILSAGILSPVSALSFTAVSPSIITPSTGMLSPTLTAKISPIFTCSTGTVTSSPSLTMTAVCGASLTRLFSAEVVFPLEYASNVFPSVISVKIIPALSKYSSCIYFITVSLSPAA